MLLIHLMGMKIFSSIWQIPTFSNFSSCFRCGNVCFVTKSSQLHVRRATAEDLQNLKALWTFMCLPADELGKRLIEFQIVETAAGKLLGAIGMQIVRQHARLHSEGYFDFSLADHAREMFWDRILKIASHHGVFRLWTQETSLFWTRLGFRSAIAGEPSRLPEEWNQTEGEWFTLQLKDEEVIANALDKGFAAFISSEKRTTARVREQAQMLKTIITVTGFLIGIVCFCVVIYLIVHRNPFSPAR
jgi:N-acetylglutamate synthase-like GNAT family acetyltransferase